MSGSRMGYSWILVILWIILATSVTSSAFYYLYRFIKQSWSKPLTTGHAIILLGFWALIQLILMNYFHYDFYYHHQWKVVTVTKPLNKWYRHCCYRPDYPPLWLYIEMVEVYFLKFLFPHDLLKIPYYLNRSGSNLSPEF